MVSTGSERFGRYLRQLREQRHLSLEKVEELSHDHPERITRSHLSRIENGRSLPTLTRLMTLSRLYGQKVSDLAERLEFDIQVERNVVVDVSDRSAGELEAEAKLEAERGDLFRAFALLEAAAGRLELSGESQSDPERVLRIQLKLSTVLIRAGKLALAAEYAHMALGSNEVALPLRVWAEMNLAMVHRRQGRPVISQLFVDSVLALGDAVPPYHRADALMTQGALAYGRGQVESACEEWSKALTIYRELGRPYEECKALRNLAQGNLVRERLGPAHRFSELAIEIARKNRYQTQLGWCLNLHAQIAIHRNDERTAASLLRQANEIARKAMDDQLLFLNHYYQWELAKDGGDETTASSLIRILRKMRSRVEDETPEIRACDREIREDER